MPYNLDFPKALFTFSFQRLNLFHVISQNVVLSLRQVARYETMYLALHYITTTIHTLKGNSILRIFCEAILILSMDSNFSSENRYYHFSTKIAHQFASFECLLRLEYCIIILLKSEINLEHFRAKKI